MADGRDREARAHVTHRVMLGRSRAESASHLNQRLNEELRRLGDELVDERVPRRLLEVIRAGQDRFDR